MSLRLLRFAPPAVPAPMLAGLTLLAFGLVLLASPALAQAPPPDPAQLDYTRASDVTVCPEEFFFRAFVAARFGGQDPFTPTAPRRITLTLRRRAGRFVAKLDMYDQAGAHLGEDDPLVDRDCTRLVENAGRVVVSWLEPLTGSKKPAAAPAREPPRAEPRSPPSPPASAEPPAAPVAPAPVEAPKPGVFGGGAGFVRALLFGVAAGALATGVTFEAVASSRADAARDLLRTLQQKTGASPCIRSAPGFAGTCQQLVEVRQQHDHHVDLAVGSFVAAGVTAATASIWTLHTSGLSVHITPSASGSLVGLTLRGSW
jgi:hypothetical protein